MMNKVILALQMRKIFEVKMENNLVSNTIRVEDVVISLSYEKDGRFFNFETRWADNYY
jgi:hypothetical protein